MKNVLIAPSILSADFTKLGQQLSQAEKAGADLIHIDVMDGHFVPNITIGPSVIKNIRQYTSLPLDVHLMIEQPEFYIDDFVSAGANWLSVHLEACRHLHRTIHLIKSKPNVKVGVALNPATALTNLVNILDILDFIVIMSVNPGFGGQKFIEQSLSKIKFLNQMLKEKNVKPLIEVDGGITAENAGKIMAAGANILVAGNSIFGQSSISDSFQTIKKAIR